MPVCAGPQEAGNMRMRLVLVVTVDEITKMSRTEQNMDELLGAFKFIAGRGSLDSPCRMEGTLSFPFTALLCLSLCRMCRKSVRTDED